MYLYMYRNVYNNNKPPLQPELYHVTILYIPRAPARPMEKAVGKQNVGIAMATPKPAQCTSLLQSASK